MQSLRDLVGILWMPPWLPLLDKIAMKHLKATNAWVSNTPWNLRSCDVIASLAKERVFEFEDKLLVLTREGCDLVEWVDGSVLVGLPVARRTGVVWGLDKIVETLIEME